MGSLNLYLWRKYPQQKYTIGKLYVNGKYLCDTMEDKDRGLNQTMSFAEVSKIKVYGETAIPTGMYKLRLNYSPKFATRQWAKKYNGCTPLLLDVPGFSGIRIHPLNTAEDSLGCIGPGENKVKGRVINSTTWFYKLMDKYLVPAWTRQDEVTLTISLKAPVGVYK